MYKIEQHYDGFNDSTIPNVPSWIMSFSRFMAHVICMGNSIPRPLPTILTAVVVDMKQQREPKKSQQNGKISSHNNLRRARWFGENVKNKKNRRNKGGSEYEPSSNGQVSNRLLALRQQHWTFVAHVIDRCVLYLYVFAILATPIFFFIIYPAIPKAS